MRKGVSEENPDTMGVKKSDSRSLKEQEL